MTWEQVVLAVLAAVALGLLVALLRVRATAARRAEEAAAETARLQEQIDDVRRSLTPPSPHRVAGEFLITDLGAEPDQPAPPAERIEGRLFADIVLRETALKAASLAHGVRRALAPENRLRMRAAVRQEMRQSRRGRKAEIRAARRHLARLQREQAAEEGAA